MTFKHITVLTVLIAALALGALVPASSHTQAQGDRLRVIASFSILTDVAANVAGDAADVESLMPLGSNPHSYAPSAQDVVRLDEAGAVLVVGADFEEGVMPVLEEAARDKIVVVSDCVPIRPVFTSTVRSDDANGDEPAALGDISATCQDHHAAVNAAFGTESDLDSGEYLGLLHQLDCGDHHDDDDDGDAAHAHGQCDPHVWMDPFNTGLWTLTIRDTFSALDPDNADIYAANAEAYLVELAGTSDEVQAIIDDIPADNRYIVTNHLAFNYFAERYGLSLVGVVIPGGSTTSEPSVQEVVSLIETIQEYNVPAIFTSVTVSDSLARQVADEAGASIASLYTGSLTAADGPADTYLNYTLANAQSMAEALQ